MTTKDLELIKKIISDEDFCEQAGALLTLVFLKDPLPLSEYNTEELDGDYSFSEDGTVFAEDGAGGFYILLEDGSVSYANPAEDECGRPAESLREFLELMLNCAYDWQNYIEERFLDDPALVKEYVEDWETEGRQQFSNAYGDEFPPYDELQKIIAKRLDLRIFKDISEDILPNLYKAVKREPEFTVTFIH